MSDATPPPLPATLQCRVVPQYLPAQSDAAREVFAFSYTITLENRGPSAAQVIARHWRISDASGHRQEVRGLALVGQQPLLQPGERFEYTSWVQLHAPVGRMEGTFFCISDDAHWFELPIAPFDLIQSAGMH